MSQPSHGTDATELDWQLNAWDFPEKLLYRETQLILSVPDIYNQYQNFPTRIVPVPSAARISLLPCRFMVVVFEL